MLPLLARPSGDIIAYRSAGPLTVGALAAEAMALAARLPERGHMLDLCTDRSLSLVGLLAALLRGHPVLLGGGAAFLPMAAAHFPDAYALADGDVPGCPLPLVRVAPGTGGDAASLPALPAAQLAAIAFTSGSTGARTAHEKPWGALVAAAEAAAERFALRATDGPPATVLATVPAQHMYGFETTMLLPLRSAIAIGGQGLFFPRDIIEALDRLPDQATGRRLLVTTPLHLRALLAAGRPAHPPTAVISATAPLSRELAAAVEQEWDTQVLEIYGASEAGSLASRRTTREVTWLPYPRVTLTSDAALVPGLGRVPLGDALEPLPDGRFKLLGRLADTVKLAGKRASLNELNQVLLTLAGVQDGVFLAPQDLEANPGARLGAVVVAPGLTAEDIVAALRTRLDPAFLPRRVAMVQALPRDALGKLSRHALEALIAPRSEALVE